MGFEPTTSSLGKSETGSRPSRFNPIASRCTGKIPLCPAKLCAFFARTGERHVRGECGAQVGSLGLLAQRECEDCEHDPYSIFTLNPEETSALGEEVNK